MYIDQIKYIFKYGINVFLWMVDLCITGSMFSNGEPVTPYYNWWSNNGEISKSDELWVP